MKNLLFLCTILSSLYINLSDGKKVTYSVGTIPKSIFSILNITCIGDCDIERVNVTQRGGGEMAVDGYYFIGGQRHTFCWAPYLSDTTIPCKMLKQTGLSNPQIEIVARQASHNVALEIKCRNLVKISKNPIFQTMSYDVGNMKLSQILYFLIDCIDDCNIRDVKVHFKIGGNVHVVGYFGNGNRGPQLTFCKGSSPSDEATACVMSKNKGLSNAAISISAQGTTDDVVLMVEIYNLKTKIRKLPNVQTITTNVGTLDLNRYAFYVFKCVGACHLKDVFVEFKRRGDVRVSGIYNGDQYFCRGEDESTTGIQNCTMFLKNGLKNPEVILKAHKKSDEVVLTAIGYNLLEVKPK